MNIANKILVLNDGKLIEEGTHDELYSQQGKYYELWQKQMPKQVQELALNTLKQ